MRGAILVAGVIVFSARVLTRIPVVCTVVLLRSAARERRQSRRRRTHLRTTFGRVHTRDETGAGFLDHVDRSVEAPLGNVVNLLGVSRARFRSGTLVQRGRGGVGVTTSCLLSLVGSILRVDGVRRNRVILARRCVYLGSLICRVRDVVARGTTSRSVR